MHRFTAGMQFAVGLQFVAGMLDEMAAACKRGTLANRQTTGKHPAYQLLSKDMQCETILVLLLADKGKILCARALLRCIFDIGWCAV